MIVTNIICSIVKFNLYFIYKLFNCCSLMSESRVWRYTGIMLCVDQNEEEMEGGTFIKQESKSNFVYKSNLFEIIIL